MEGIFKILETIPKIEIKYDIIIFKKPKLSKKLFLFGRFSSFFSS